MLLTTIIFDSRQLCDHRRECMKQLIVVLNNHLVKMVWNDGVCGDHVFEKVARVRAFHHVVLHPREGSGPRGFPVGP